MVPKTRIKKKVPPFLSNKKLIVILFSLIIATLFAVTFIQFNLSVSSENQFDAEAELLKTDLALATKPFYGATFPLESIFGQQPIWGTLNSGHYFSLRLSKPQSIETGLMWFKNQLNNEGRLDIRHLCDQNNRLDFYAWTRHDFYNFGEQTIIDGGYQIRTSFHKGSTNELEWRARIDVELASSNSTNLEPLSLVQYVLANSKKDHIKLLSKTRALTRDKAIFRIGGTSKDVGEFELSITLKSPEDTLVHSTHLSDKFDTNRYSLSSFVHSRIMPILNNGKRLFVLAGDTKPNFPDDSGLEHDNLIAYQLVAYAPATYFVELKLVSTQPKEINEDASYDDIITRKAEEFDTRFEQTFPIDSFKHRNINSIKMKELAKVALSNMIGSIGYFYGQSYIGTGGKSNEVVPYGPIQLLTGVPSRSFFPRGFLWDEGFHNILIGQWDPSLSNKIIKSWFNIMNINGWMPREVILGVESMRRVPHEFIIQHITNANPPAMMLAIERLLDAETLEKSVLNDIYPKLKAWYNWFNVTQAGLKPDTFRWRGRDEFSVSMLNPKTLTSGLDDYPRASHPSPDEYHIDLRCWMAKTAMALTKLAHLMGDLDYYQQMKHEANELFDNDKLDRLHWSENDRMYCDYGHNTDRAELVRVTKTRRSKFDDRVEKYQVLERHSTGHPEFGCVHEFGYVSLFPMIFGILKPTSEKLGILLDRLRNEEELWSPFGIRSLSKASRYYNKYNTEHDKPYWRGAVWLNLNYLILSSLKSYSTLKGPHKDKCAQLFNELKLNLVDNVVREFERTNYIWENYDDQTGHGKGSHPFTGWSSLILLIISSNLN